jgi:hypothetical protein
LKVAAACVANKIFSRSSVMFNHTDSDLVIGGGSDKNFGGEAITEKCWGDRPARKLRGICLTEKIPHMHTQDSRQIFLPAQS